MKVFAHNYAEGFGAAVRFYIFFAVSQLMPRVARREQSDGVSTVRKQVLGLLPKLSAHINVCLRQLAGQRRLLQEFSFLSQAGMSRHIISNSIRLAIRGADKSASHPTQEEDRGMSGFGTVLIGHSEAKKNKSESRPNLLSFWFKT